MKIGISTGSFFPKIKTEDAFDMAKSLGAETMEIFLSTFSEYLPEFGELLQSRKGDMDVYSIHTLNQQFEPELFNFAERTRKDCEFFMRQASHVGKLLGAKYYIFHGPARLKKKPYNINYPTFGKRCDEIDDLIFADGINLLYENVHWAFFNFPDFFNSLKEFSKIGACLDIKQAMQSGISVYEYLDSIGNRLKNIHVCDYNGDKLCLPNKGEFDFDKFFAKLKEVGYDGAVMLEVYSGDYQDFSELKDSLDFLKSLRDKYSNK